MFLSYRTIIEADGKQFHGYVPALIGCHTYGKTIAETKKHLKEAIECYVESLVLENKAIPHDSGFESLETIQIPLRSSLKEYA